MGGPWMEEDVSMEIRMYDALVSANVPVEKARTAAEAVQSELSKARAVW